MADDYAKVTLDIVVSELSSLEDPTVATNWEPFEFTPKEHSLQKFELTTSVSTFYLTSFAGDEIHFFMKNHGAVAANVTLRAKDDADDSVIPVPAGGYLALVIDSTVNVSMTTTAGSTKVTCFAAE